MVGFGPGTGWMAIRDRSQAEVADFFALSSPRACPWLEGVSASAKGGVVAVTPPLSGVGGMWTLVTGSVLLFTPEQTSLVSELLVTEVHYYATDRRLGRLYWCRADDDKRVEGAARMAGVEGDDQQAEDDAMAVLDETSLTSLAGQYSLDPTTLAGQPADGPLLVGGWA